MEERDLVVLRALGLRGMSPEDVGDSAIDGQVLRSLVAGGDVEEQIYEIHETTVPGAPPSRPNRHFMLTAKGAEQIGLDPSRIGLA